MDEKQLQVALASYMKDDTKRNALAELIIEWVEPQHISTDFIGLLLNTRSLNPGK